MLALFAGRALYGDGRLMGGALLPAPDSASDLWRTYTQAWHPVGVGSATDSPPYLAVVALLGVLLLNHASTAVDVLLLGAVPLAGVSAYLALRPVVTAVPLRAWGAATYALLPPVVGAVATGRLSTARRRHPAAADPAARLARRGPARRSRAAAGPPGAPGCCSPS